jgi:hypothetical protein
MFDLIPDNQPRHVAGGMEYQHKNIDDLSLYSDLCRIRKVNVEAVVPQYDRDEDGREYALLDNQRLEGFSALVNEATGELLQTRPVADSYKLVPHDELFAMQAGQLGESQLPIDNVTVTDRLFDGGLRAHRTVMFNDLDRTIGDRTDRVVCRMDIFNSVDMSWAFQIFSGAYRDLCRNTLVFGGEKAYHQKRKHTRNLSPEALVGKATMGLEFWENDGDTMNLWSRQPLTRDQFADLLADTICAKPGAANLEGHGKPVNERLLGYLLHRYDEEVPNLGRTMWAAYNALTHWSTHLDTEWTTDDGKTYKTGRDGAKPHMVERKRQNDVRAIIDTPAWTELASRELAGAIN